MIKIKCSNNSAHKRFVATVIKEETWIVDDDGDFLGHHKEGKIINSSNQVNTYKCRICGGEVVIEEE